MEHKEFYDLPEELLEAFRTAPRAAAHVLNLRRYLEMRCAFCALNALAAEEDGWLHVRFVPEAGYGTLSLETEDLIWRSEKADACAALFLADNLEIYPLINGRIRLNLMFYRLMLPVGEKTV